MDNYNYAHTTVNGKTYQNETGWIWRSLIWLQKQNIIFHNKSQGNIVCNSLLFETLDSRCTPNQQTTQDICITAITLHHWLQKVTTIPQQSQSLSFWLIYWYQAHCEHTVCLAPACNPQEQHILWWQPGWSHSWQQLYRYCDEKPKNHSLKSL